MKYRKNKNRNLCQVGILCQSQEFMPQVARGFVYFVFMFIKLIFIASYRNIICILSSLLVAVICHVFWAAVNDAFYSKFKLKFSFLSRSLSDGSSSSIDNNQWYRISTSYWVENLQLSSCLSIKSTREFKWCTKTLWHNGMKILVCQYIIYIYSSYWCNKHILLHF